MDICLSEKKSKHEETNQMIVVTKSSSSYLKPPTRKISKRSPNSPSRTNSTKKDPSNIKRDPKRHKMIFKKGGIPAGTALFYNYGGKTLRTGYAKDHGIFCTHCNEVVSPSQFEKHAGKGSHRKPYEHIFLSNGESLHEYASSMMKIYEKTETKKSLGCLGCQKGGDVSICDRDPTVFHNECIPYKKRFCEHCKHSMKSLEPKVNAAAWKSTVNHRIRTADSPNEDRLVACAICRSYEFNEDGFTDQTVIVCDQCEQEFHIGCFNTRRSGQLMELPSGNWFCSEVCDTLYSDLKVLLTRGPEKVPDSLMDPIKKKLKDSNTHNITNPDVKWIIVRGSNVSEENQFLLKEAVDIFHDCFNPIIDSVTGKDFIPSMAYGLKMGDSNFSGVYSAMLTIDSKVVTAGMFRILGREIAEFPIVATSKPYQGKGYFQLFLTCFEKLLSYYEIKKLVLPAAKNAKDMWINKFRFNKVTREQLREYRVTYTSMVYFLGTTWLEKMVPKSKTTVKRGVSFSINIE